MLVSIHFFFVYTCLTEYFVRAGNPKNVLTHRYHPTTFYSNQKDEPDTAADEIQYAYEGGESQTGEVTSPQDNDYQESNLQTEVQHDYQPELHHDYQGDIHHDYQPNALHEYQPDTHHEYQPEIHHDYSVGTEHHDEHGSGYPEHHGYRYNYNIPEHGYLHEEPSIGYHYPPPPLPAIPAAHAMVETPKQVEKPLVTYYYLGRHLWYIPLYFSIYFIIYVGALVLKSVARHKIQFPYNLQMAAVQARTAKSLEEGSKKFYM
ncbi:component of gems protein 1 [Halyomorpha halys]|uniref:component of gems protein 1 n=1 Tax=Halyomorpha halys TaxID=286706 RepID=UPI0006D4F2CB|nr:component of gems protein 1 [Halyomorpha halys]